MLADEEERQKAFSEFPVLLKQYNRDGTRKSARVLLRNMLNEIEQIREREGIDEKEKEDLIKDCEGMYFELLYREIIERNSKFSQIKILMLKYYGSSNGEDLVDKMSKYFREKLNANIKTIEEYFYEERTYAENMEREAYAQKNNIFNQIYRNIQLSDIVNLGKVFIRINSLRNLGKRIKRIFFRGKGEHEINE